MSNSIPNTKPAIKVVTASGFSICRDAYEFARAIVGEYGTKAEYAAMIRLWPRFLGLEQIEITAWPK